LENLAERKRLAAPPELTARKQAWARAYESTPHGQPVSLSSPRQGG
jgi:hypothetical protein